MADAQFTSEELDELEANKKRREAFRAREKRKKEAIEAARSLADIGQEAVGVQEQALLTGRTAIREQAAKALAGSLSSVGPLGSGAGLAAARQSALSTGVQLGQFETQAQAGITGARQEAARQLVESRLFEEEVGDTATDRQARMNELEAEIQSIFAANKGVLDDDEYAASESIKRLAADEQDPVIRQRLLKRAEEVRAGREDF